MTVLGGAPLLQLRAVDEHAVEGRLMANAAGPRTLVARTSRGVVVATDAVRYMRLTTGISVYQDQGSVFGLFAMAGLAARRCGGVGALRGGYALRVFLVPGPSLSGLSARALGVRAEFFRWLPRFLFTISQPVVGRIW